MSERSDAAPPRRLFLAIRPPDSILDFVEATVDPCRPSWPPVARSTRRDQWHLTLVFIGSTTRVDDIVDRARVACSSIAPFELAVAGPGAFPTPRRAKVLWLGVAGNVAALGSAVARLDRTLEPVGVPRHDGPYRPHFTVGRLREPTDVHALLGDLDAATTQARGGQSTSASWTVGGVTVFESFLGPAGARYGAVAECPFGVDPSV